MGCLCSCLNRTGAGILQDPTVDVKTIDFESMGLSGVHIKAHLQIFNPNLKTLNGTQISYQIRKQTDGTVLGKADVPKEFTVPANDSVPLELPITLKYSGVGAAGASIMNRGETELAVDGTVTFVAPLSSKGTIDIPFKGVEKIMVV